MRAPKQKGVLPHGGTRSDHSMSMNSILLVFPQQPQMGDGNAVSASCFFVFHLFMALNL